MIGARIGHGYDLHRLEPVAPEGAGRPFVLGGLKIDHDRGPVGHSDGDALLHAVTDAILGALAEPDIGQLFSDRDPRWDGADSTIFLAEAVRRMKARGLRIGNVDATIVAQAPKMAPHIPAMCARIAQVLALNTDQVNVKAKTAEKMGPVGEGRAIETRAVCLLWRAAQ